MADPTTNPELAQRLHEIQGRISAAASRANRDPAEITLIAVTKTHTARVVAECLDLGLMDIGENRVQEFLAKHGELAPRGTWHFIGHLQRNKAAQVVGRAEIIHSVDSARLVEEIEKRAGAAGITQRVLLEINIGLDPRKTSAPPDDLPAMLDALSRAPHVRAEGFMTVPPHSQNPEDSRPHFRRLRDLMQSVAPCPHFHPVHLSMGMSGDFEEAIGEGATMIRLGSALFGEREQGPEATSDL